MRQPARAYPPKVHPLLVPPEALEPTGAGARPDPREPSDWTVDSVALTSLLAVAVSLTTGVSSWFAPMVVPCAALVACGFWHVGRRVTRRRSMVLYCLGGGAVAGTVNGWLLLCLCKLLFGSDLQLSLELPALVTLWGAVLGIVCGVGCLLPMLTQLSARSLRRPEGVDRCLVGYGLWGLFVLFIAFSLVVANTKDAMHVVVFMIAAASFVLHAWMVVVGTVRWARRRWWLRRASQGKVVGWLVCDRQRFEAGELEALQLFGNPLFTRPRANRLRVLARGGETDAYRGSSLTPKYLVC